MNAGQQQPISQLFRSAIANVSSLYTVVAGASGGIGQPLSLLLKSSPLISELALYDVVNTPGVAADLSHISTPAVSNLGPADPTSPPLNMIPENHRLPPQGRRHEARLLWRRHDCHPCRYSS